MRPRALWLLFTAWTLSAAETLPSWIAEAARQPVPAYPAKVDVAVLLAEEHLSIENDGKRIMRERGVLKCVAHSGRCRAVAYRSYNSRSGRIRDFRGWLLNANGKESAIGKDRIVDTVVGDDSVEVRSRSLDPGDDFRPGTVFAYEVTEEEKSVFTQAVYPFQGRSPALVSRYVASLPAGWEASARLFNHPDLPPTVAANTYTWELRNLPWVEPEPASPDFHAIAPRLAVSFFPTANNAGMRPLGSWAAVAAWLAELTEPQSQLTPALQAKAAELTAGAADPVARIRAIAAFVQQTRYVSIQMNLTRGGGYVPHRADDVLRKNYGDCKDKANLMRTLLKAVNIESHLAVIYSGARDYVRPEWPSTHQFNHMILAVRVPAEVTVPTVTEHPTLGRLLLFDPTDPFTPLGDLPEDEQGSHVLIVDATRGALLQAPLLPPAANRTESTVTAQMAEAGSTRATLATHFYGQAASRMRYAFTSGPEEDTRRILERDLTARLGGLTLHKFQHQDQPDRFALTVDLEARQFGQIMQSRLLIIRPGALLSGSGRVFPALPRKLPVKLSAEVRRDQVRVALPAGFVVDELPEPVSLTGPYGRYIASWKADGAQVSFEQMLELQDHTAPASDYAKVREFFEAIAGAENGAVVLVRK